MVAKKTARNRSQKKLASSKRRSPKSPRGTAKARKAPATKKSTAKSTKAKTRKPAKKSTRTVTLGRPRIAGTAELNLVFQKDLEAREIFSFLDVRTLNELEALGPEEILEQLTAPMVRTVDRIRKVLAMSNRSLKGDQKFARDFKKQLS